MTVAPDTEAEVRRLFFAEHWKRGTIATQLGVHPDVVECCRASWLMGTRAS
ncbi:MAG: integrase [Pseudomonadota bacterium]